MGMITIEVQVDAERFRRAEEILAEKYGIP